jgi:hypothetical protein
MPNWCENETDITGPKDVIDNILAISRVNRMEDDLGEHFFSMRALHPIPDDVDWYSWCIENWGTKWDIANPYVGVTQDKDTATINLSYDTAWSPPIEFFQYLSRKFPDITISTKYYEPGMEFIGERTFSNGKSKGTHKNMNKTMWKKLGFKVVEGQVDWDSKEDYSIWDLFPLKKGK